MALHDSFEEEVKFKRKRMFSVIRAQIILAGGREMDDAYLSKFNVSELLDIFARNGIDFEPKFSNTSRFAAEDAEDFNELSSAAVKKIMSKDRLSEARKRLRDVYVSNREEAVRTGDYSLAGHYTAMIETIDKLNVD
jgi:hypothetical protein